jgi:hypothetical protein
MGGHRGNEKRPHAGGRKRRAIIRPLPKDAKSRRLRATTFSRARDGVDWTSKDGAALALLLGLALRSTQPTAGFGGRSRE